MSSQHPEEGSGYGCSVALGFWVLALIVYGLVRLCQLLF